MHSATPRTQSLGDHTNDRCHQPSEFRNTLSFETIRIECQQAYAEKDLKKAQSMHAIVQCHTHLCNEDPLLVAEAKIALGEALLWSGNHNNALEELQQAEALLQQISHTIVDPLSDDMRLAYARLYVTLGGTYYAHGHLLKAITCDEDALHYAEQCGYEVGVERCLRNLGHLYWLVGLPTHAIRMLNQGLARPALKNTMYMQIYSTLAEICDRQGHYELAISYGQQACQLVNSETQLITYVSFYCRLVKYYLHSGDLAAAEALLASTVELHETDQNPMAQRLYLYTRALLAYSVADTPKALEQFRALCNLSQQNIQEQYLVDVFILGGRIYLAQAARDSANAYLTKARLLCQENNLFWQQLEIYQIYIAYFREQALWQEAFYALVELNQLEHQYHLKSGEIHLALFRREERKRTNQQLTTQNRRLQQANQQLTIAHRQKDEIIATIADELQRPINEMQQLIETLQEDSSTLSPQTVNRQIAPCLQIVNTMRLHIEKLLKARAPESSSMTAREVDSYFAYRSRVGSSSQNDKEATADRRDSIYRVDRQRVQVAGSQLVKSASIAVAEPYTQSTEIEQLLCQAEYEIGRENTDAANNALKETEKRLVHINIASEPPLRRMQCRYLVLKGAIAFLMGDLIGATAAYEEAQLIAKQFEFSDLLQNVQCQLGHCYWHRGHVQEASTIYAEAMNQPEKSEAFNLFIYDMFSYIYFQQNQISQAIHYRRKAIVCLRKIAKATRYELAHFYCEQAFCEAEAGQWQHVERTLDFAYSSLPELDQPTRTLGLLWYGRSRLYEHHGQIVKAEQAAAQALTYLEQVSSYLNVVVVLAWYGELCVKQAHYERAEQFLHRALTECRERNIVSLYPTVYDGFVSLYQQQGRWESAFQTLTQRHQWTQTHVWQTKATWHTLFESEQELIAQQKLVAQQLELQQLALQLEQLGIEKDEMLAIVAHDLKNPLGILRYSFELLAEADSMGFDNEMIVQMLHACHEITEKMRTLVGELLEAQQAEMGRKEMQLQRRVVSKFVAATVQRFQITAENKAQRLTLIDDLGHGKNNTMGYIEPVSFDRVLENIISNALKYSAAGTETKVVITQYAYSDGSFSTAEEEGYQRARRSGTENVNGVEQDTQARYICINVHDQGQGFTAAEQNKLFTKFSKLSSRPTGGESSTGLGLYAARKLMRGMAGEITASSPGKDQGSTFTIWVAQSFSAIELAE